MILGTWFIPNIYFCVNNASFTDQSKIAGRISYVYIIPEACAKKGIWAALYAHLQGIQQVFLD